MSQSSTEETDDGTTASGLMREMARRSRPRLIVAAIVGLVATVAEVALPVAIGWAVDRVVAATGPEATDDVIGSLAGAVGVIALVVGIAAAALSLQMRLSVELYVTGRLWIERRLTARVMSRRGGVTQAPGSLLSLSVNDARKVGDTIDVVPRTVTAIIGLLLMVGWLVVVDPVVGAAALCGTLLAGAVIAPLGKPLAERTERERARLAEASAALSDSMIGLGQAKGLRAEPTLRRWFRGRSSAIRSSATAQAEAQARMFAVFMATPIVSIFPALWFASSRLIDGSMTVGQFVTVLALTQYLQWPTMELVTAFDDHAQGRASARRVQAAAGAPPALPDGDVAIDVASIDHLRVDDRRHDASGHDSIDIPIGGLVGVDLGDPGRATELAAVLARRRQIAEGLTVSVVTVGGEIDLARWSLGDVAARVAIVDGGHPWLPSGPLREAVRLASPSAHDDPIRRALQVAAAEELLAHPDGLDRPIGERGVRLSGGQRQRVAVAQAMLADVELLIVVEPTSALDTVTEGRLAERLGQARAGRPTLVFSSSAAVLERCEVVVAPVRGRLGEPDPVA
ncbi:MAG: ABC transporter ATP-binding protein [Actinomycetota bacterium]